MGWEVRRCDSELASFFVRIAVTGASGFVGRHVLAELERRSLPAVAARIDLHNLPANSFQLLGRPDLLIHLAWSGLDNYRSSSHIERELPAHVEFLERMLDDGVTQLLVAGTCLEYGMKSGALDESMDAMPVVPYAAAKDELRRRLEDLKLQQNFRLTWARLFYLYGEGQSEKSLFSQLRAAVTRGDKNFDLSSGDQLRDYLPVQEAARLLVDLSLRDQDPRIVNVCSGQPISVRCITEKWVQEFGWQINLDFGRLPYNDYEPMEFWGVRSKLDRLLSSSVEIAT